jgi:hypothetical protein
MVFYMKIVSREPLKNSGASCDGCRSYQFSAFVVPSWHDGLYEKLSITWSRTKLFLILQLPPNLLLGRYKQYFKKIKVIK